MRKDMKTVLTERPRSGSRSPNFNHRRVTRSMKANGDLDSAPSRAPMGRPPQGAFYDYGVGEWEYKQFSDHLSPLRRYLDKQVGRPWNKVYSEIREHLRFDSTQQRHILEHVKQDVTMAANVILVDGVPCEKILRAWSKSHDPIDDDVLYVDPKDGIIKRGKHKRRNKVVQKREAEAAKKKPPTVYQVGDRQWKREENGLWYEVWSTPGINDYGASQDVWHKRALGKKELKQLPARQR